MDWNDKPQNATALLNVSVSEALVILDEAYSLKDGTAAMVFQLHNFIDHFENENCQLPFIRLLKM